MQTPVSGFIFVLAFRLAPFARLRLQIILVIASDPLRARNSVGPTNWRSSQEWSPTAFPPPADCGIPIASSSATFLYRGFRNAASNHREQRSSSRSVFLCLQAFARRPSSHARTSESRISSHHLVWPLPRTSSHPWPRRFLWTAHYTLALMAVGTARPLPLAIHFRNTYKESVSPCPVLRTLARIRLPPAARGPPREIGKINQNTNLPTYLYSKRINKNYKNIIGKLVLLVFGRIFPISGQPPRGGVAGANPCKCSQNRRGTYPFRGSIGEKKHAMQCGAWCACLRKEPRIHSRPAPPVDML